MTSMIFQRTDRTSLNGPLQTMQSFVNDRVAHLQHLDAQRFVEQYQS